MLTQERGQFWHDGAWDSTYVVSRVWKKSIRLVNVKNGITMQASKRSGMTEVNGWRCIGGLFL